MSNVAFRADAYSTAVIDSIPANPWQITSHQIEQAIHIPEKKLGMTADEIREYHRLYQSQYRKTDRCKQARAELRAKKRAEKLALNPPKPTLTPEEKEAKRLAHLEYVKNYKRMKRAAERVNPERSHGYTQADSDKTAAIAGKPNWRRSE